MRCILITEPVYIQRLRHLFILCTAFFDLVLKSEKLSPIMKVIDTKLTLSCNNLICALHRLQKKSLPMDTTLSSAMIALYTFRYQMLETNIYWEIDTLSSFIWRYIFAWGQAEKLRWFRLQNMFSEILLLVMEEEYWHQFSHPTVESSSYCLFGLVHSSIITM